MERPQAKKFVGEFYSPEELQTLLVLTEDESIYIPIVLAAFYGLRRSEALGLSWDHIDFERKEIHICQKVMEIKQKGKTRLVISDEMKTEGSRRTLPLIPDVEEILLHISKRKAAWMLQNGIIPCEIRNTPKHKYSVRKEDVLAYMAKSEREKRKEIPVGIFNAKKTNNPRITESPDSYCGGYFDDTHYKLRGKERARFKEMLEDILSAVPDTLTVDEVAELTGYHRRTVLRYVQRKYIYAVNIMGKYYISKQSIINYLATDKAFKNTQKSEWHEDIIIGFFKH